MPRVLRRPQALEDVLETWNFIAGDDVAAADRWVDALQESLEMLASQPLMGRAPDALLPGVRSLSFGSHVLFYVALEDGIELVRVLSAARDLEQAFPWD